MFAQHHALVQKSLAPFARSGRQQQQQQKKSSASKSFSVVHPKAQKAGAAVMDDTGEVTIRRRPPAGHKEHLGMGSERFAFKMEAVTPSGERVDNEENKPRNILEEIVWYKDYELNVMKEKIQTL